jgi:hypothetical protein
VCRRGHNQWRYVQRTRGNAFECYECHLVKDKLRHQGLRAAELEAAVEAHFSALSAPPEVEPPQVSQQAAPEDTHKVRDGVKARGSWQAVFREELGALWGYEDAILGGGIPWEMMTASHTKPVKFCSPAEAVNIYNGLPLTKHLDHMLNDGWLTILPDWSVIICPHFGATAVKKLGLAPGMRLRRVFPESAPFFAYHREYIYKGTL